MNAGGCGAWRRRSCAFQFHLISSKWLQEAIVEAAHPHPPLTSVERSDLNNIKAINAETSKGLLFPTHKDSRAKAIRRALNKLQQNEFVEVHNTSLDLTEKGLLFFRSIDLF